MKFNYPEPKISFPLPSALRCSLALALVLGIFVMKSAESFQDRWGCHPSWALEGSEAQLETGRSKKKLNGEKNFKCYLSIDLIGSSSAFAISR